VVSSSLHGLLLTWALAFGGAAVEEFPALLAPIIAAREEGRAGQVAGSVALEPRTPQGPAVPLPGAVLVLVPRSSALLRDLEQFKTKARESEAGYFRAATDVSQLTERYQQALDEAGAGDLVFAGTSDTRGEFVFFRVPVGDWLLLGRHEIAYRVQARQPSRRDREHFVIGPRPAGYRAVTYWLVEVRVVEGDAVRVELTDRNPWLRGVVQEGEKPQGR